MGEMMAPLQPEDGPGGFRKRLLPGLFCRSSRTLEGEDRMSQDISYSWSEFGAVSGAMSERLCELLGCMGLAVEMLCPGK